MSQLIERFPNIALSFADCHKSFAFLRGNPRLKDLSIDCGSDVLGKQVSAEKGLETLCEMLSTLPNLETLWLRAWIRIQSHASITEMQAYNLQFVLSKLAAAAAAYTTSRLTGWHGAFVPKHETQSSRSAPSKDSIAGSQPLKVPLPFVFLGRWGAM